MVSTSESEVTINLPLHDLALGRVSFDFWLFLRSAWPNTLRAFLGKITPSRPGVDISLLHCLATGTRNMAPKATSGSKYRGPSFATPLWDHIYKYCAQPLFFFHGNSMFRLYSLRSLKCTKIDGPSKLVLKIPQCRLAISINFSDDEYSNE